MSAKLAELAERFDCELRGNADVVVDTVGTLAGAGATAVAFLANPHYRSQLVSTSAGAVIVGPDFADGCPVPALINSNPYATYARIAAYLHPAKAPEPGIHASALVGTDAVVAESAQIGANAVVGSGAVVGQSVIIGAGCVVGSDVRIGDGSVLKPRVTVHDRVTIGRRCRVHSGAVIGGDGFGFALDESGWLKVPQLGSVVVGDDVSIGANTTIDRGTIENTLIGDGVILDNLIQIGHNVRIGAHTAMAALCGISGSTTIGQRCLIAGAVVMVGHIRICDDVIVNFHSTVTRSISAPGTYSSTVPADEAARWRKNAARVRNLDDLARRQNRMEKRLEELERREKGNLDDG
jgi:UDP-3-O-[3-hydroxymyristoyl] glucosamine N-acyltransferase